MACTPVLAVAQARSTGSAHQSLEHIAPRRVRARPLETDEALVRLHLRPGLGHVMPARTEEAAERMGAALWG